MGRRKKAVKKVVKKKKYAVDRVFKCLFCNQDQSVTYAKDMKSMTGQLLCTSCGAQFETKIHSLTDPVDVFTEWLDETTEAQARSTQRTQNDFVVHDEDEEDQNADYVPERDVVNQLYGEED